MAVHLQSIFNSPQLYTLLVTFDPPSVPPKNSLTPPQILFPLPPLMINIDWFPGFFFFKTSTTCNMQHTFGGHIASFNDFIKYFL